MYKQYYVLKMYTALVAEYRWSQAMDGEAHLRLKRKWYHGGPGTRLHGELGCWSMYGASHGAAHPQSPCRDYEYVPHCCAMQRVHSDGTQYPALCLVVLGFFRDSPETFVKVHSMLLPSSWPLRNLGEVAVTTISGLVKACGLVSFRLNALQRSRAQC